MNDEMVVGTPAKKIVFVDTCLVPAKILRKRLSDRLGGHKLYMLGVIHKVYGMPTLIARVHAQAICVGKKG